jgi:hypothetical protein
MRDVIVLQLHTDVKNPEPDRRSKDWTKLPVIKAGLRFLLCERGPDEYATIESSGHAYAWTTDRSALGKLILANSQQVGPESVRELKKVHDCDWGDESVLRILLKLGRITPEDFAAVAAVPEDF